jgi:hypothetical protein
MVKIKTKMGELYIRNNWISITDVPPSIKNFFKAKFLKKLYKKSLAWQPITKTLASMTLGCVLTLLTLVLIVVVALQ